MAPDLPPRHAPYVGGDPYEAMSKDLKGVIEAAITNHPRSLQERIGPSEFTDCDHCLAAKLAGWSQTDRGAPWLPTIGTAVHAWLEEQVITHENHRNANHTNGRRWLTEQKVTVGQVGGVDITGHVDLVDLAAGLTVDFKVVGDSTLRTARTGPSSVYRTQAALYAKGLADAGHRIEHVGIAYLPRNRPALDQAIWWTQPYDPTVAVKALERANRIHTNLTALAAVSTEARDQWITGLDRAAGCWDCTRYPDGAGIPKPGHRPPGSDLTGLIPPGSTPAARTNAA